MSATRKISKIGEKVPTKVTKAVEPAFAKIVDTLNTAQATILTTLDAIEKDAPCVPETLKKVEAQRRIANRSRAPELKDLAKAKKQKTLHTNPEKLKRLINDLNSDIAQINNIEGSVHADRNTHFGKVVDDLEKEIAKALPATVSAKDIALDKRCVAFKQKQGKAGWGSYAKDSATFKAGILTRAADLHHENEIKALTREPILKEVRPQERDKIIDAALKAKSTVKDTRKKLEEAYDKQIKPSKARWASYLELGAGGSYTLKDSGAFQGAKIHLTMSNDSWTSNADGKVSLMDGTPDKLVEKLLKLGNGGEMHATLEIGRDRSKYPHVYLFAGVLGNDTKWAAAKADHGKDDEWEKKAQKEMTAKLDAVKTRLKQKLKDAKDTHGRFVY